MIPRAPSSSSSLAPPLHWDGTRLVGTTSTRGVTVTVPARLVALRCETLPPAALPALKAAARFKAERTFAVLGPVVIDAVLAPPREGHCTAVLMALPQTVLEAIRVAVQAQGRHLLAVRVAELMVPIAPGGVVEVNGERSLVSVSMFGMLLAIAPLGAGDSTDAERVLARERLRLSVAADAPARDALAPQIDFLHPTLSANEHFFKRRGMRAAMLAVGLVALISIALGVMVWDALAARSRAHAEAERYQPIAAALAAQRADMKELAGWFGSRPSMTPALSALSAALPNLGSSEQVRLVRVRQAPGEDTLAEGSAADRAQMLGFLTRLRQDSRVAAAEIRSFRAPAKGSEEVIFELALRLRAAGDRASTTADAPRSGGAHADA